MSLEFHDLSVSFGGRRILNKLSGRIKKGEFFGIAGPNGSGKTTLLNTFSGWVKSSGTITADGRALSALPHKKRAAIFSVLPQQPDKDFSYTVTDVIKMGGYLHQSGLMKKWTARDQEKLESLLEALALTGFSDAPFPNLSGGERQRVLLAKALMQRPDYLLLDEPTNHLDLNHQMKLLEYIDDWRKENGTAVIAVFHDLNIASVFCDRLLLLKNGEKVAEGSPSQILTPEELDHVYHTLVKVRPHSTLPAKLFELSRDSDTLTNDCLEAKVRYESDHTEMTFNHPVKIFAKPMGDEELFSWQDKILLPRIPQRVSHEKTDGIQVYWCENKKSVSLIALCSDKFKDREFLEFYLTLYQWGASRFQKEIDCHVASTMTIDTQPDTADNAIKLFTSIEKAVS